MTIDDLLEDERVRALVVQAMHAETALSFDIGPASKRKAIEQLRATLEPFSQRLAALWVERKASACR